MHVPIGKVSFEVPALLENYLAVLDELNRAKPAAAKGRYLKGVAASSTMGPGVQHRPGVTVTSDAEKVPSVRVDPAAPERPALEFSRFSVVS